MKGVGARCPEIGLAGDVGPIHALAREKEKKHRGDFGATRNAENGNDSRGRTSVRDIARQDRMGWMDGWLAGTARALPGCDGQDEHGTRSERWRGMTRRWKKHLQ